MFPICFRVICCTVRFPSVVCFRVICCTICFPSVLCFWGYNLHVVLYASPLLPVVGLEWWRPGICAHGAASLAPRAATGASQAAAEVSPAVPHYSASSVSHPGQLAHSDCWPHPVPAANVPGPAAVHHCLHLAPLLLLQHAAGQAACQGLHWVLSALGLLFYVWQVVCCMGSCVLLVTVTQCRVFTWAVC